jgi:hypothetical protein
MGPTQNANQVASVLFFMVQIIAERSWGHSAKAFEANV